MQQLLSQGWGSKVTSRDLEGSSDLKGFDAWETTACISRMINNLCPCSQRDFACYCVSSYELHNQAVDVTIFYQGVTKSPTKEGGWK